MLSVVEYFLKYFLKERALNNAACRTTRYRLNTANVHAMRSMTGRKAGSLMGANANETVLTELVSRAVPYAAVFDASLIYW
ncbi:hypothetical protein PEC302107_12340 [Pectobacterium araliae]|uniref:Uncharacterized protein n=1 Tax=Pectobacterium araliae TaxID=3073862 RepID=A0AAN0MM18_9GAMM|nr:hypothetical protein PEC302110_28700 [Pectobacterium sp. MAFF 302110]GKW19505.1 hypothetical protein PEC302107_12340 [Pectobacterium carotovorum subsp. carotovorum]